MKQIKTTEELLQKAVGLPVSKPGHTVSVTLDARSVMHIMRAYAEQFIDAAAEEILVDDSDDTNRKIILKLKEQLK